MDIRPVFKQKSHHLGVTSPRCSDQWGIKVPVHGIDMEASGKKFTDALQITLTREVD